MNLVSRRTKAAAIVLAGITLAGTVGTAATAFIQGHGTNNAKASVVKAGTVQALLVDVGSMIDLVPGSSTSGLVTVRNLNPYSVGVDAGIPVVTLPAGCTGVTATLTDPAVKVLAAANPTDSDMTTATLTVSMVDSLTVDQTACLGAKISVVVAF